MTVWNVLMTFYCPVCLTALIVVVMVKHLCALYPNNKREKSTKYCFSKWFNSIKQFVGIIKTNKKNLFNYYFSKFAHFAQTTFYSTTLARMPIDSFENTQKKRKKKNNTKNVYKIRYTHTHLMTSGNIRACCK